MRVLPIVFLVAFLIPAGCRTSRPLTPQHDLPGQAPAAGRAPSGAAWRAEAQRWNGTPYKWGGTGASGIDCSGFTLQMYWRVAGARLPRTTVEQYRMGRPIGARELRPGDLVFFQTNDQPISHVGVWLGNGQFAHASVSRGVTVSNLNGAYYAERYRGAKRILR